MSYEKFTVKGVDFRTNPNTGEITRYVEVERVQVVRLNFKTASQLGNLPLYESLKGQDVLIQVREGVMDGRPWTAFDGDGMPVSASPLSFPAPVPASTPLAPAAPTDVEAQPKQIGPAFKSIQAGGGSSSPPPVKSAISV